VIIQASINGRKVTNPVAKGLIAFYAVLVAVVVLAVVAFIVLPVVGVVVAVSLGVVAVALLLCIPGLLLSAAGLGAAFKGNRLETKTGRAKKQKG